MRKTIWIPLVVSIGTMTVLYLIGNIFNLSLFRFSLVLNETLEEGWFFSANIAILPFIIGTIVGFIAERMVKKKN